MTLPEQIPGASLGLPLLAHVGWVRVHRASRITWHAHGGYELLFLLEGATSYEFKQRAAVELHGGDFLVIPPRVDHRGWHGVRAPSTLCGLALAPLSAHNIRGTPFSREDLARIQASLAASAFCVRRLSPALRSWLRRLREEMESYWAEPRPADAPALLRLLLCAVLLEMGRQMSARRAGRKDVVGAGVAYLRQHAGETVRMPALVRHLGFSRARVFQLFRSELGMSPNDCLQRVRIERALELLRDPKRSVTEVALATGFSSSQYFSTVFRRYTGCSPTTYRHS